MLVLSAYNIEKFIENEIGGFNDNIYVVSKGINNLVLSMNSTFDWLSLTNKIEKKFKESEFSFVVLGLDLIINW